MNFSNGNIVTLITDKLYTALYQPSKPRKLPVKDNNQYELLPCEIFSPKIENNAPGYKDLIAKSATKKLPGK